MTMAKHIRRGTPASQAQMKASKESIKHRPTKKHVVLAVHEKARQKASVKKTPRSNFLSSHPSQPMARKRGRAGSYGSKGPGDGTC